MGTDRGMDVWLNGADRSDLYSDEGTLFGHLGMGAWAEVDDEMRAWLLREN
jgi:hypothetical protein